MNKNRRMFHVLLHTMIRYASNEYEREISQFITTNAAQVLSLAYDTQQEDTTHETDHEKQLVGELMLLSLSFRQRKMKIS